MLAIPINSQHALHRLHRLRSCSVSESKAPIDLRMVVQTRLDQLMKPLRLKNVSKSTCAALHEGTSSDFTQGVQLNESVGIFLDWWGWGMSNRYSFAVFERAERRWQPVRSRIKNIHEAIACALHTLALRSCAPNATTSPPG